MRPITRYTANHWMPSIFDEIFDTNFMRRPNVTAPAINVIERAGSYEVEVAAPGMTKDDVKLHVDADNNLVIALEKKQENQEKDEKKRYLRREFNYQKFQQTILLPEDVDKKQIAARVSEGILTISLPKLTPEDKESAKQTIEVL